MMFSPTCQAAQQPSSSVMIGDVHRITARTQSACLQTLTPTFHPPASPLAEHCAVITIVLSSSQKISGVKATSQLLPLCRRERERHTHTQGTSVLNIIIIINNNRPP